MQINLDCYAEFENVIGSMSPENCDVDWRGYLVSRWVDFPFERRRAVLHPFLAKIYRGYAAAGKQPSEKASRLLGEFAAETGSMIAIMPR